MGNSDSTAKGRRKTTIRITHGHGKETLYEDEDENTYTGPDKAVQEMAKEGGQQYVKTMKVGLQGAAESQRALPDSATKAISD